MANDVRTRFKSFLPGAGFSSAGAAKQGKTRVVGTVTVTSYVKGGETLGAVDVGLSTIDAITLKVSEQTGSPSAQTERQAVYSPSAAQFYLVEISNAGVKDEYEGAATETIEFVAEGDSANDVELT